MMERPFLARDDIGMVSVRRYNGEIELFVLGRSVHEPTETRRVDITLSIKDAKAFARAILRAAR
jgi:hypothetical protein